MPHAYRLSKKFSDTFGEEIADEFVNWFNGVDTTYRTELREQNDRNWQRFADKLDKRTAELRAETQSGYAELRAEMQAGFAELRVQMQVGFADARAEGESSRADMASFKAEMIKWMFLFWAGTISLNVALIRLLN